MSTLRDALRDLSDAVFFDLLESDEAYLLVMDVPGVSAESLEVAVENDRIVIDAKRAKSVPADFQYVEEHRSLFLDAELPLPGDATETGAEARVDRGVLELHLPKRPATGQTPIDVVSQGDASADGGSNASNEKDADGELESDSNANESTDESNREQRDDGRSIPITAPPSESIDRDTPSDEQTIETD